MRMPMPSRSKDVGEAKAQVLVVDDEPGITRFLRDALTRHGYAVSVAADGHQALQLIDRHPVDIVVLDLMLPGMDGFEVLEHLASRSEGPQIDTRGRIQHFTSPVGGCAG